MDLFTKGTLQNTLELGDQLIHYSMAIARIPYSVSQIQFYAKVLAKKQKDTSLLLQQCTGKACDSECTSERDSCLCM